MDMIEEIILIGITLIWLVIASFHDIKTREIPDWISFSLIGLAFVARGITSLREGSAYPLLWTGIGLVIGIAFSLLLYYTKQWGGGDAKLFMANVLGRSRLLNYDWSNFNLIINL